MGADLYVVGMMGKAGQIDWNNPDTHAKMGYFRDSYNSYGLAYNIGFDWWRYYYDAETNGMLGVKGDVVYLKPEYVEHLYNRVNMAYEEADKRGILKDKRYLIGHKRCFDEFIKIANAKGEGIIMSV